jgi:hypothetical protein
LCEELAGIDAPPPMMIAATLPEFLSRLTRASRSTTTT